MQAGAEQHEEEAELAHGAVREQQLEVVLAPARAGRRRSSSRARRPRTTGRHGLTARTPARTAPTTYTPAFTIVAEWRYALTGVGATIAPGSHAWNGYWADFVIAPTSTRRRPTVTAVSRGRRIGEQLTHRERAGRLADQHEARPASPGRPCPVTSSACRAAARARGSAWRFPISRYEVTEVSSQKVKSPMRLSDHTSPSIEPANSVRRPTSRPTSSPRGAR